MDSETRDAIGFFLLLAGLALVVGSVWMMKGPLVAGLIAGGIMVYAAINALGRDD